MVERYFRFVIARCLTCISDIFFSSLNHNHRNRVDVHGTDDALPGLSLDCQPPCPDSLPIVRCPEPFDKVNGPFLLSAALACPPCGGSQAG